MIRNEEELEIVRQHLLRVESAVDALRREVLPMSEERFLLMAEAYVEQILALRREIDAFGRARRGAQEVTEDAAGKNEAR